MKEQNLLAEENIANRKVVRTQRKWIFITTFSLLILIFFLHFFGSWSISYHSHFDKSDGLVNSGTGYFYNNQCLLFNQSHKGEVYLSEEEYRHNTNSLLWIIFSSFRFTFVDHFIVWLIFAGIVLIVYGFTDSKKKEEHT